MKKEEVAEKVKDILTTLLLLDEKPKESEDLFNDLGADSLDIVEFVMEVEKEFSITIPDEDIENIRTVGSIVNYTHEKLS